MTGNSTKETTGDSTKKPSYRHFDYAITTETGFIPFLAFPEGEHFNRPRILFADDFIFKDSLYATIASTTATIDPTTCTLNKLTNTTQPLYLAFKNPSVKPPRKQARSTAVENAGSAAGLADVRKESVKEPAVTLFSRHGNYKLTESNYEAVLKIMAPAAAASIVTGELHVNSRKVVEPKDLHEFLALIACQADKSEGTASTNEVEGAHTQVKSAEPMPLFGTAFVNQLIATKQLLVYKDGVLSVIPPDAVPDEYLRYLLSINEINGQGMLADLNYKALHAFCTNLAVAQ